MMIYAKLYRYRSLCIVSALAVFAALQPARTHAADPKKSAKITYEEHVLPILRDNCIGCHNPDKSRSGLVVSTYAGIMAGGSSGEVIKPGDPDASRLLLLVSHKQEPFMPPKSAMIPAQNVETIRQWILGGALENSGSKAKIANKPKFEIALSSINKGKPEGPQPLPIYFQFHGDPIYFRNLWIVENK